MHTFFPTILLIYLNIALMDAQQTVAESNETASLRNGNDADRTVPLAESVRRFDSESRHIVDDYLRHGKKLRSSLRSRLILFLIQYSPIQDAVMESNDPQLKSQVAAINTRLKSALNFKYTSVKSQIDALVRHMMTYILAPFILINPLPPPDQRPVQMPTTQLIQTTTTQPAVFPAPLPFQPSQPFGWQSPPASPQFSSFDSFSFSQPSSTFQQWPTQPASFGFQQTPPTSQQLFSNSLSSQPTIFMPAANNPSPAVFLPFRSEFVQPAAQQQFVWDNGIFRR